VYSTDSQSFAESGDGLTPDSTSSASRVRSSFASVSTDSDTLDTVDDAKDQFVVTPSTQITFFGTPMGGDYARD
jgi:hypothetical protein